MRQPDPRVSDAVGVVVMVAVFAGIGAFVVSRRPRHPIGWMLITIAFAFAVLFLGEQLGWHFLVTDGRASTRAAVCLWIADWFWIGAIVPLFIVIPLLFPTGRPLSPGWRRFMVIVLADVALFVAERTLARGALDSYPTIQNPFGVIDAFVNLRDFLFAGVLAGALVSVVGLVIRFRGARGAEREQIKWVWMGWGVLVVGFVTVSRLEDAHPELSANLFILPILAIPVAIAIAMLRHRLFDVDVVINRTLVYAGLTASLAGVYLTSVLLSGLLLAPITSGSGLAVAISTLAVAALFRPVRARIQSLVDRRFYRRRYDAVRTLDAFNARLRDEIDLDSLVRELGSVVDETVQPAHVSLWLR